MGAEEVMAASVDGKVESPPCYLKLDPKQMLQHMAGYIFEKKVGASTCKHETCGFCGAENCKT